MKVAILDDYARAALEVADWSAVQAKAEVVVFDRHLNEDEAVEALKARRIAGAGIDVYDREPPAANHPFRTLDNVTATPHLGYVTRETLHAFYSDSIEAVAAFLDGAPIRIANPQALEQRPAPG